MSQPRKNKSSIHLSNPNKLWLPTTQIIIPNLTRLANQLKLLGHNYNPNLRINLSNKSHKICKQRNKLKRAKLGRFFQILGHSEIRQELRGYIEIFQKFILHPSQNPSSAMQTFNGKVSATSDVSKHPTSLHGNNITSLWNAKTAKLNKINFKSSWPLSLRQLMKMHRFWPVSDWPDFILNSCRKRNKNLLLFGSKFYSVILSNN